MVFSLTCCKEKCSHDSSSCYIKLQNRLIDNKRMKQFLWKLLVEDNVDNIHHTVCNVREANCYILIQHIA